MNPVRKPASTIANCNASSMKVKYNRKRLSSSVLDVRQVYVDISWFVVNKFVWKRHWQCIHLEVVTVKVWKRCISMAL